MNSRLTKIATGGSELDGWRGQQNPRPLEKGKHSAFAFSPDVQGPQFSFFFLRFFSLSSLQGRGLGVGFVFFFLFPFTQFLAARENCGTVTPMGKYMLGKKRMRYIRNHNLELGLAFGKRMCSRCGEREVYQDTKTMDWCEPCIAEFVDGGNDLHIAR
jgi:hypothetical protein